jgi:phosphonoacetaldehyde hydrolase
LPLDEWKALPEAEKAARRERAYRRMETCGAHYVVDDITGLIPCLDDIERRLKQGEKP